MSYLIFHRLLIDPRTKNDVNNAQRPSHRRTKGVNSKTKSESINKYIKSTVN